MPPPRQAQRHRPQPQHGAHIHWRLPVVGRLVRLQRRLGRDRGNAGRHGHDRDSHGDVGGRIHLDAGRMDDAGQTDRRRHLHRRYCRPRRHYPGVRFRRPGRLAVHRDRGRHSLLLGLHRLETHAGL